MISLPFGLTGSSGTGTEEWYSGVLDIWMALFREAWSARWVEADLEDGGAMVMQAGESQLHFRLYQAVQHAALGSTANQLHRTSHYRFVSKQTVSG